MNPTAIEASHKRWANLHPTIRFGIVALVVGAIGVFAVKPGYAAFKGWRARQNLVAARVAVVDSKMAEARDRSLAALRGGAAGIETYRILEQSMATLRDPLHAEIARLLLTHPESSDEDRLKGFGTIVSDAPMGLVGQAWIGLPRHCQDDPRFATVLAGRSIAEGRLDELEPVLLALPATARTPAVERCLIEILIARGRPEELLQAQRRIGAALAGDPAGISEWLDLLEKIPVLGLRAGAMAAVRRVLESTAAGDPARKALMLARLDYAADFPHRAAILDRAIERWQDAAPEALARFLVDLGLDRRLLATLPMERVESTPGVLPWLLVAMRRSEAWGRLGDLLDAHGGLLPKFEEWAYRAVLAAKTGDAEQRGRAWHAAMREARFSAVSNAFLRLQRVARENGMPEEAEKAMLAAIRTGRGPLPLVADQRPLLASLGQQGRDRAMMEVCAIYLMFEVGNPVLLTQYAYLACLTELAEPSVIVEAMESLAKDYPDELHLQWVIATAFLIDGRPVRAMEIVDSLKFDPAKLPLGFQAMLLVTRVLNHRMAADDPLILAFPWSSLLPAERHQFGKRLRPAV